MYNFLVKTRFCQAAVAIMIFFGLSLAAACHIPPVLANQAGLLKRMADFVRRKAPFIAIKRGIFE